MDLSAHVYYSVVETADRYYITYADFHARDWDEPCKYPFVGKDRCHENDMEGATIVVKKDGTRFGSFELVATQAHGKMLVARNDHRIAKGTNEHLTDAPVTFDGGSHAQLFVQSKGHGVCVMHDSACGQEPGKFPGGDGIYYHVGDAAETPSSGNDRDVAFALTPMADTLWARRHDIGTDASLFGRGMKIGGETVGGAFNGGDHEDDAANPPWAWHDGGSGSGDVLLRPAETFNRWVKRPAPASTAYVSNPFRNGSS